MTITTVGCCNQRQTTAFSHSSRAWLGKLEVSWFCVSISTLLDWKVAKEDPFESVDLFTLVLFCACSTSSYPSQDPHGQESLQHPCFLRRPHTPEHSLLMNIHILLPLPEVLLRSCLTLRQQQNPFLCSFTANPRTSGLS